MREDMLTAINEYLSLGWNVIPLGPDKEGKSLGITKKLLHELGSLSA